MFTEIHITFTVPISKEVTRIDKNGKESTKNISYPLQFSDSTRFMARSSSDLVNDLSEGIHIIKCKFGSNIKNVQNVKLNVTIVTVFLHIQTLKMIW